MKPIDLTHEDLMAAADAVDGVAEEADMEAENWAVSGHLDEAARSEREAAVARRLARKLRCAAEQQEVR